MVVAEFGEQRLVGCHCLGKLGEDTGFVANVEPWIETDDLRLPDRKIEVHLSMKLW